MAKRWSALLAACAVFAAVSAGAAAQEKEPVVIRWLMYGNKALFEQVLEPFHEQNPDIRVEFDIVSRFVDEMVVRAATGLLPDVTILNWGTLGLVDQGHFIDLTPYVVRDGIDLSDYVLQTNLATYQGKIIGLPWGTFTPLLFYNKGMFDESGLAYPDHNWDWSDLNAAATALTRRGSDGKVSRWGMNNPFSDYEFGWRSFIGQAGGRFYNDDFTRTLINSPEAVEAMEFLIDLNNREVVTPYNASGINFSNWGIAMDLRHPSGPMSAFARDPVDWEWGIEIAPMGKVRAASMNTLITGVTTNSKHPEEAWRLVKYLASADAAKMFALLGRALPSHRAAYSDPAFYDAWGEMVGADLSNLAHSMPLQMANPFWVPVHLKEGQIVDPVWDKVGREILTSGQDPRVYLEALADKVNGILAN